MSNSADSTPALPTVAEVLDRVASVAGAKNDADIARALKVSPQTLSTWRKRHTLPFEAVAAFSRERGCPLDYLVNGIGTPYAAGGGIDPDLLGEIFDELLDRAKEARLVDDLLHGIGFRAAYFAAIVYNRIWRILKRGEKPHDLISEEVKYLIDLNRSQHLGTQLRVHPEEALHVRSIGATVPEVFGEDAVVDHSRESKPKKQVARGALKTRARVRPRVRRTR